MKWLTAITVAFLSFEDFIHFKIRTILSPNGIRFYKFSTGKTNKITLNFQTYLFLVFFHIRAHFLL